MKNNNPDLLDDDLDLLDSDLLSPSNKNLETDWLKVLGLGLIYTVYSIIKYYYLAVFSEMMMDMTVNNTDIYLISVIFLSIAISMAILAFAFISNCIELILITRGLKRLEYLEEGVNHTLITSAIYQLMAFIFISAFHHSFPYTEIDNFTPLQRILAVLVFVFLVLAIVAKNTRKRIG